jgi:hypothetical protein
MGQQGQNLGQSHGQQAQRTPSDQEQRQMQERQQQAWDAAAEREKSNNPATKSQREYGKDAPGMDPANQPDPDTKLYKATRLDLEDITGNPGHRGVNPDAPANSINKDPNDSINEPRHIDQNWPQRGKQGKSGPTGHEEVTQQGSVHSINEPAGSQVIPPGAGAGTGEERPGQNPDSPPLKITSIEPDSAEVGGGNETFGLIVTGEGFNDTCKIVFDDEEVETEFVNETTLRATPPMSDTAEEVDVEVERGGETSEVLTFEFTASGGGAARQRKEPTRKPKKPTPSASRDKSGKKKRK